MSPSDFTADLPSPRDDEPESLRADIIDELADHLQCAIRREELRSASEPWGSAPREETNDASDCGRSPDPSSARSPDRATQTAYNRALARFGDPRTIARKLWWDAMSRRIMMRRITITTVSLAATAACIMAVVLAWQTLVEFRAQSAHLADVQRAIGVRMADQLAEQTGRMLSGTPAESTGRSAPRVSVLPGAGQQPRDWNRETQSR